MSNLIRPLPAAPGRPRVVFLGMPCAFSAPPLAALIAAGMDVAAVVLPGPPGRGAVRWHRPSRRAMPSIALPALPTPAPSLMGVAQAAGIPLLFITSVRSAQVVSEIARLRPDAIAVACFPWRLPSALLGLPPLGALNLHPSLLPQDRGPSPLFWVFHRGATETGVTVHLMEEAFDAGPIVLQRIVPIEPGMRLADLDRGLAEVGGELLVEAITVRAAGDRRVAPQDGSLAIYAPNPTATDYVVDAASWPVRRAYTFVRGVQAATVRQQNGDLLPVSDAIRWESPMTPVPSSAGVRTHRLVSFTDGWIELEMTPNFRTG